MTIEINDRLYRELTAWAKANGMDDAAVTRYIEGAVRDRLALDKYGDLNEKVGQPEPKKRKTVKKSAQPNPDEQINELINEPINEQIKEEPPKRRTKVLTSK